MTARDELAEVIRYGRGEDASVRPSEQDANVADAILAAGYRKAEPIWVDTLTNDGAYEYTISSDCDGSNVYYWRRIPGKTYVEAASPWEAYEPAVTS